MSTLLSVEVFTKNLPCFNTTLTPFLQAELGKTRNTLCIWEYVVPPVLPSTHQQRGFCPRHAACFPPRENEPFPRINSLLTATGSLGKQRIYHSSQKSMATWVCLP